MENAIIVLIMTAAMVIREGQHRAERKDLMDRIMSVDYLEYKKTSKPAAAQRPHVRMTDEQMAAEENRKG